MYVPRSHRLNASSNSSFDISITSRFIFFANSFLAYTRTDVSDTVVHPRTDLYIIQRHRLPIVDPPTPGISVGQRLTSGDTGWWYPSRMLWCPGLNRLQAVAVLDRSYLLLLIRPFLDHLRLAVSLPHIVPYMLLSSQFFPLSMYFIRLSLRWFL